MAKILIQAGPVSMAATLNDSETAKLLVAALPCESNASVWGDEIYFTIPIDAGEENGQAQVPSGTVAYWPPGSALCVFFGQTPCSPVNVVGSLDGDPKEFAKVSSGDAVKVSATPQNQ